MTNSELIKKAAKAVGIEHPGGEHSKADDGRLWDCKRLCWWNPIKSDADAFQLAVMLKMEVYHADDEGEAVHASYVKPNSVIAYCIEYYNDLTHMGDPQSATRMAIVRAAGMNV